MNGQEKKCGISMLFLVLAFFATRRNLCLYANMNNLRFLIAFSEDKYAAEKKGNIVVLQRAGTSDHVRTQQDFHHA